MSTSATTTAFPTPALQAALAASVANGTFADTAYYLYSQRGRNWKIGKPRAVYANSGVMKATAPHFHSHFNEDTAAGQKIDCETEDYDYESDSDIDDSEEDEECTPEAPEVSDGVRVYDDDSARSTPSPPPPGHGSSPLSAKLDLADQRYKYRVVIPDVAANTWQALVHFVYTGTIYFAPLKSQGLELRRSAQKDHREKNPHLPPLCSPKSVYRLAEFVGLDELKRIAQNDLKAKINSETVVREVFSRFSSMYNDILNMQLEILYTDSMLADTLPKVLKLTSSISQGNMPYSEKALAALLTKLSTFLVHPAKPKTAILNASPRETSLGENDDVVRPKPPAPSGNTTFSFSPSHTATKSPTSIFGPSLTTTQVPRTSTAKNVHSFAFGFSAS